MRSSARGEVDRNRVITFGRSLGTALAAHVAAEHAKWGEVVRRANIRLD